MSSLGHAQNTNRILQLPVAVSKRPEISMAPLIDIVFLLLIFFMVTTVFPDDKGIVIEKPKVTSVQNIKDIKLSFSIDQKGNVYYQKSTISPKDVERIVKETVAANPTVVVLVKVDKRAATESFMTVMDAAKLGGAQHLGIAGDEYKD